MIAKTPRLFHSLLLALQFCIASTAFAQSELPMFDIFDSDGAVPFAENQDITAELQWALDNRSQNYIIVIPPGPSGGASSSARYKISSTIEFPQQYGGAIIFGGASTNTNVLGYHCELEWTGTDGGTMFEYTSTDWRFYGAPHFYAGSPADIAAGTPLAAVGWQTTKVGAYNAGRMTWEACTWHGFDEAAIQLGLTTAEANNEINHWGDCYFKDCAVGMKVIGAQALQQEFRKLGADGDVPYILDIYASGCIWAESVYLNSTLIRFNAATRVGGSAGSNTGKNNGYFRFNNVKSDTGAIVEGVGITLVEFRDEIRADVLIDGGLQSGGDVTTSGSLLKMLPYGSVTLRNYRCLGGGAKISGTGGVVIMDSCRRMSNTGTFASDIDGGVELIQRNCMDYDGNLLASPINISIGAAP